MIQRRKIQKDKGKRTFTTTAVVLAAGLCTACGCGESSVDIPAIESVLAAGAGGAAGGGRSVLQASGGTGNSVSGGRGGTPTGGESGSVSGSAGEQIAGYGGDNTAGYAGESAGGSSGQGTGGINGSGGSTGGVAGQGTGGIIIITGGTSGGGTGGSSGQGTGGINGSGGSTGGVAGQGTGGIIIITGGTAGMSGDGGAGGAGAEGNAGYAGAYSGGFAGSAGTGSSSGQAGTGGIATGGTAGVAGSSGTGGTGGIIIITGGAAGEAGAAGYGGAAGASGSAGQTGSGGAGGSYNCISTGAALIIDGLGGRVYREYQNAWTHGTGDFDSTVSSLNFDNYEVIFEITASAGGLLVCSQHSGGDYTACKPDYMAAATETHNVEILLFGESWIITEMNAAAGVLTNETDTVNGGSLMLARVADGTTVLNLVDGQEIGGYPGLFASLRWRNYNTGSTNPDALREVDIYRSGHSNLADEVCQ